MSVYEVDRLMAEVRRLAVEYRETTGKTLPLTAELAVNDAVRLLDLTPVNDPHAGFDATRTHPDRAEPTRIVIKGRAIFDPERSGLRIGQLRWDAPWDEVVVVLMDEAFAPVEIYAATREDLAEVLDPAHPEAAAAKGARKGGMTVARFKILGELVWDCERGRHPRD